MFLRLLAAAAALFLVSCGSTRMSVPGITPYRIEIQQGNFVSQEMIAQLKPGMSRDQVRFVMGTPLITDSFHGDRWDYVFRRQKTNSTDLEQRRVAVFFEDGKLQRVDGDVVPAAGADAPPKVAGQSAADAPKAAADANQPAAAPAPSGDAKPQEKGWWQRLKDKLTR